MSLSYNDQVQLGFRKLQVSVSELNEELSNLFNLKEVLTNQQELTSILAYQELEIDGVYLSIHDFGFLEQFLRSSDKSLDDCFCILFDFQEDMENFDFSSFSKETQDLSEKVKKLTSQSMNFITELEESLNDCSDLILRNQLQHENRFQYKNLLQNYMDSKINWSSFRSRFLDLSLDESRHVENANESWSIVFVSDSKLEIFGLLIDSLRESVLSANKERFHQEIQKFYIDIQKYC
jgi:hypothetical protein